MDGWAWIILAGLTFSYLAETGTGVLQARRASSADGGVRTRLYGIGAAVRAGEYGGARQRLTIVASLWRFVLLVAFWWSGGFQAVDSLARSVPVLGGSEVVVGVLFFAVLGFLGTAAALPVRLYATFRLEECFGFNRSTPGLFAADVLKGFVVTAAIGAPVGAAALYLLGEGTVGWVIAWVSWGVFSLLMQIIVPRFVLPIFNRFTPLPEGPLRLRLLSYAREVAFPLEDVRIMDASRRSTKGNAFFTGSRGSRRVVLFDTLIDRHPDVEIVAILAHEVGHYKKRHVLKGLAASFFTAGLVLLVFGELADWTILSKSMGVEAGSVHAALLGFALALVPVNLLAGVVSGFVSRRREREADDFAARTTGDARSLAAALVRLGRDNLAEPNPHPLYVAFHYGHPPLLERVERLTTVLPAPVRPASVSAP